MSCPPLLLVATFFLYLGTATTASVPLFAPIDWLHEGERFGVVQSVASGGTPFRDVSIPHGLFPEVIRPLLAFRLLGESILADRIAGFVLAPLAYVAAVYFLCQLFEATWWRVVALITLGLFPLLLEPRHIIVFLALGLLTAGLREEAARRLFWGGALCGLGFVASTFDQAVFLCATAMALGVLLLFKVLPVDKAGEKQDRSVTSGWTSWRAAGCLLAGLMVGLAPFLGYLAGCGIFSDFLEDLRRRAEWERFIAPIVWPGQAFPALPGEGAESVIWYVVPLGYLLLVGKLLASRLGGNSSSLPLIWPTLLFGLASYGYAIRQYSYWKLAVVLFPFVVGAVYLLSLIEQEASTAIPVSIQRALAGSAFVLGLAVLAGSLLRAWTPKQVWPRVLFPSMALGIVGGTVVLLRGYLENDRRRLRLILLSPLVAFVLGIWFFNNVKPQVLQALLKKPQMIKDVAAATAQWRDGGTFSRDASPKLNDDTLAYIQSSGREGRPVLILAVGAGVYYFQAAVRPPSRYPHIEQGMSDASVQELIEGLDRSRGELLVACGDNGQRMTGWPMHPRFRDYVAAHYVDSGRRLQSFALGEGCPFSVWVHRMSLLTGRGEDVHY